MAHLVLRNADGFELLRREMAPQERYAYYRQYDQGDPFVIDGRCYRIKTLAWRKPEQDLMILVQFQGWAPTGTKNT